MTVDIKGPAFETTRGDAGESGADLARERGTPAHVTSVSRLRLGTLEKPVRALYRDFRLAWHGPDTSL